jgi:hypothetical protein
LIQNFKRIRILRNPEGLKLSSELRSALTYMQLPENLGSLTDTTAPVARAKEIINNYQ